MRGNQWQSMAIEKEMTGGIASCARQSVAINGHREGDDGRHRLLREAISGNQWQSVAIGGTRRHSVALGGNQWQSVAITLNRRHSVALGGTRWHSVAISGNHLE